uniref:Leucine-rich, glioma inactivated 1a n=1 Tax=Sinocyclocheilus anshuiensis TaxID=1608454 RepID=A0A671T6A7_9TELE
STGAIPRSFPPDAISLSFVKSGFNEIPKESLIHTPDKCFILYIYIYFFFFFLGLPHLEYLFIENNQIKSISPFAFRGLKSLIHLSLAYNNLETLLKDLFRGMEALTKVDLRGNLFSCDCKLKWLVDWMFHTNATVDQIFCNGPQAYQDLSLLKSLEFQSISVEPFAFGGDQFVVFGQPFVGRCSFMEWDHVQMEFRNFDNITRQYLAEIQLFENLESEGAKRSKY